MAPDVHHRQRRMPGNGQPGNGISVHGRWEAEQCHHQRIHEDVAAARGNGWILSTFLPVQSLCQEPVLCSYRGWIILDDEGGWRPAEPAELP